MRAVVFAYHNMGIIGLEALKRHGYEIAAVFTCKDDPGEVCWFASVSDWAKRHKIPVFCPQQLNTQEWIAKIATLSPDVIFSFYYRQLIPEEILKMAPAGAFNLHGSLLPAYRGRCPVNWVLVNGEDKTGVTLHYMIDKPDAGDIVCQRAVTIDFSDTALTLFNKLYDAAKIVLDEALPQIMNGTAPRIPQDLSQGSYFGGRKPEDGRIDWNWSAVRIYNLIRAVTVPYPGAFTLLPDGGKIIIWQAMVVEDERQGQQNGIPGTVENKREGVFIYTGGGKIKLIDIEYSGKRMTDKQISEFFKNKQIVNL